MPNLAEGPVDEHHLDYVVLPLQIMVYDSLTPPNIRYETSISKWLWSQISGLQSLSSGYKKLHCSAFHVKVVQNCTLLAPESWLGSNFVYFQARHHLALPCSISWCRAAMRKTNDSFWSTVVTEFLIFSEVLFITAAGHGLPIYEFVHVACAAGADNGACDLLK